MTRNLLRLILLGGLIAGIILGFRYFPPPHMWHQELQQWRQDLDHWGLVLLGLAFIPASLIMLPASVLFLLAGFFYDLIPALVAVSLGSALAAAVLFLIGRFLARDWLASKLVRLPLFRALDHAVVDQGFRIVFLTRLSPLFPFVGLNYAFSVTRIPFGVFMAGTWIGMIPTMFLWVYLGSTMKNLEMLLAGKIQGEDSVHTQPLLIPALGLGITLIVTLLVTRMARQSLARAFRAEAALSDLAKPQNEENHLSASIKAASRTGN